MRIEELIPLPKDKVLFALSSYKSVPKSFGCYILATFDNHILYIGLTDNLHERFKQHLANPEKTKPTVEGKAILFYFHTFNSNNLEQLERTWLNQFVTRHGRRPILNKVDSPVG
jgi:predicted GIY-YIG superfamily endonuclease